MITPGCLAQQLSKEASQPRSGDVLYKIQQDYTTSGAKGSGVVWDFRTQKADNDTYRVGYTGKIDSVLCHQNPVHNTSTGFPLIRCFL